MGIDMRKASRGFTLIELLVVIAIIGMLSSIVLASMNSARMKARDAKRIADLAEIRSALELYFTDKGYYPRVIGSGNCDSTGGWDCNGYFYSHEALWESVLAVELAPYIDLPSDPLNTGSCPPWSTGCYTYTYGNPGRATFPAQFDLTAQLEDPSSPHRCAVKQYRFYFDNQPWCGGYSGQIYEASY